MTKESPADTRTVTFWMRTVSEAALSFEGRWTMKTLRRINPGLHEAMSEQLALWGEACVCGTVKDVAEHGGATVRGYQALTKAMLASGEADDAYVVGFDARTGLYVAIGEQKACGARVREVHGERAIFLSPDEVAGLVASVNGLAMLKQIFPGAEIIDRHPDQPAKAESGMPVEGVLEAVED